MKIPFTVQRAQRSKDRKKKKKEEETLLFLLSDHAVQSHAIEI